MKKQVSIDQLENIFKAEIDLVTSQNESNFLDEYLKAAIRLHSDFSIEDVDDDLRKDFLSFRIGCHPSQHNSKKHPIIYIIRHFNPNAFNGVFRYDYSLGLHFDGTKCQDVKSMIIDSKDFESLKSWYEAIVKTPIHNHFKMLKHVFFDAQLIRHKYGW